MLECTWQGQHTTKADDMKRTLISALTAALLLSTAACGTAQHSSDAQQTVSTEATDTTYSRVCSSDCGVADEPAGNGQVVACGWATDDLAESVAVTPELALACDYRVTGEPCEEDEICAVQQVLDTGDFDRSGR